MLNNQSMRYRGNGQKYNGKILAKAGIRSTTADVSTKV